MQQRERVAARAKGSQSSSALDAAFDDEIAEASEAELELANVPRRDQRQPVLDDDQRPADAARVGGDIYAPLLLIDVDRHKFAKPAGPAERPQFAHKYVRLRVDAEHQPIDEDDEGGPPVDFAARE